jgi:AraC-like DNA-binding protein
MKLIKENSNTLQKDIINESSDTNMGRLSGLILAHTPYDRSFELRIPGVHVTRASRPDTELVHAVAKPSLCVIAQGAKIVMLGQEVYEYDASRMLIFSVDLPVTGQVTRASHSEPYLSFKLDIDPHKVTELVLKVYPNGVHRVHENRGVYTTHTNMSVINAIIRLIELIQQPGDAELLGPLVIDEILIRLLRSPVGIRVAQIGLAESGIHEVMKAVSWLRENFAVPMKVEDLAELANMSASSFHQHFKSVTSMSPLQYQKVLRLQEARRLMLSRVMDAGTASWQVGYQSPSQFSREYGRYFGNAPSKDISRLREQGFMTEDVFR